MSPFFFGRPPFAPFARAAVAFASDRTDPPFRPSATAAGFLRGIQQESICFVEGDTFRAGDVEVFRRDAVAVGGVGASGVIAFGHQEGFAEG